MSDRKVGKQTKLALLTKAFNDLKVTHAARLAAGGYITRQQMAEKMYAIGKNENLDMNSLSSLQVWLSTLHRSQKKVHGLYDAPLISAEEYAKKNRVRGTKGGSNQRRLKTKSQEAAESRGNAQYLLWRVRQAYVQQIAGLPTGKRTRDELAKVRGEQNLHNVNSFLRLNPDVAAMLKD